MNRPAAAALLLLCCSTSAWSQTDRTIQEPDRTIVRKDTPLDFSVVEIEGGTTKPVATYIPVRRPASFDNLIKVRGSFAPELQKSVDRL